MSAIITGLCQSIRSVSLSHPEAFALMASGQAKPASLLPLLQAFHETLADLGSAALQHRVCAYYDLLVFLWGFLVFEREYRETPTDRRAPLRGELGSCP